MSSQPYVVHNPAGNNRDLAVFSVELGGQRRQIALLRPGDSFNPQHSTVQVEQRQRPPRLEMAPDGTLRRDQRPGGPPNSGAGKTRRDREPKGPSQ